MLARLTLLAVLTGTFVLPVTLSDIHGAQAAATKKKPASSGSSADRAKLMEIARKVCRKKYGASSTVYRLDYARKRVICVPPGY